MSPCSYELRRRVVDHTVPMKDDRKSLGELADLAQTSDEALAELVAGDRERRTLIEAQYPGLFAAATRLFFDIDPVGINFESNTDEYESEVGTVLPRLESAGTVADVERIVREEFVKWFGASYEGHRTDRLASELWSLWKAWKSTTR
jgi:hypothetical protein